MINITQSSLAGWWFKAQTLYIYIMYMLYTVSSKLIAKMHPALFYDIKHCLTLSPVSVATQYSCTMQVLHVTKLLCTETQDWWKMYNFVSTLNHHDIKAVMSWQWNKFCMQKEQNVCWCVNSTHINTHNTLCSQTAYHTANYIIAE